MPKKEYDVIIVGAGVSGLMLAKLLDNSKLKVLVLEIKPKIDIHPKSYGTFTETAKKFKLEKAIDKYFDSWAYYGPTVKASRAAKGYTCLVNFQKWAKSLKLKNVKIRTGVLLKSVKRVKGGMILKDHKRSYQGRMIVDSSGYSQIVKKLLGLATYTQVGLAYEVELKNCKFPIDNEASFILNFRGSNSGGWLYMFSKSKGQYGWVDFYPESESNLADIKKRTEWFMRNVPPQNKWMENATITYSYGRFGPCADRKHKVYDNLIAIGDAGGCGAPVTLEGFREAIHSAKMAHDTILKAKTYVKEELEPFLALFHDKFGKHYRMQEIVKYIYLRWARNEDIDRWLANFKKLNKEDFFKTLKGELTASLMLKTLDGVLLMNLFLNMVNNLLPSWIQFRESITPSKKEVFNAKN